MEKRLKTQIAVIALGFAGLTIVPFLLVVFIYEKAGISGYDSSLILNLLYLVSLVMLIYGVRRLIKYGKTVSNKFKNTISAIFYAGIFMLFLFDIMILVHDFLPSRHPLLRITLFINTYKVHYAAALLLFIWGMIISWGQKENMDEIPTVFSKDEVVYYFQSLGFWGWTFNIFIAALIAGYIFSFIDARGKETPEGAVVTIGTEGNIFSDPIYQSTNNFVVEQNDTVKKIHRVKQQRMLITMTDGKYGWYEIAFLNSDKGWNGYLFKNIQLSDLKVSPDRESRPVPEANREGFRRGYSKNTEVRVITTQHRASYVQIAVYDTRAEKEVTGWVHNSLVRINGQMHNNAGFWLWIPFQAVNTALGKGFFAGVANLILLIAIIPLIAFFMVKFISTSFRFIPNFLLMLLLIGVTLLTLSSMYFTFFDPSPFNWGNWQNDTGHLLYLVLAVPLGIGIMGSLIEIIYEQRCTSCKHWYGYAYNRKLLNRNVRRYKRWTETRYKDGSTSVSNERYETHTNENWKDYCECAKCGNRWTLRRHIYRVR